jgi:hypothetical protein
MPYKTKYIPDNPTKYIGDPKRIICRSLWERKFCKYLDLNKNVVRWSFESIKIPYMSPIDKKVKNYIPDFLVETRDKNGNITTTMVEIKPKKQTEEPKVGKKKKKTIINESLTYAVNQAKWNSAKIFCEKHSIRFQILTEEELF